MHYIIRGVDPTPFQSLFGLSEAQLHERGARRYLVDEENSFPDRVSLSDLPVGAYALLVNHEHLPTASPYRSRHAIFIGEHASEPAVYRDKIPGSLYRRLLSVRSFDAHGMMLDGEVMEGKTLEAWVHQAFTNPQVQLIHAHTARRGCFLAAIERCELS